MIDYYIIPSGIEHERLKKQELIKTSLSVEYDCYVIAARDIDEIRTYCHLLWISDYVISKSDRGSYTVLKCRSAEIPLLDNFSSLGDVFDNLRLFGAKL